MAVELEKFLKYELPNIDKNHPDKEHLERIRNLNHKYLNDPMRRVRLEAYYARLAFIAESEARKLSNEELDTLVQCAFRSASEAFGITEDRIKSRRKDKHTSYARRAVHHVLRLSGLSLYRIGKEFGNTDHTTALHYERTTPDLREVDPLFNEGLVEVLQSVNAEMFQDRPLMDS